VAAFGVSDPGVATERLVVVAESRQSAADGARLRDLVVDRVGATVGVPPDMVVIAAPGSVRKTSSGKIRRSATRAAYLSGRLGARHRAASVQLARLLVRDVAGKARRALVRGALLGYAGYVWAVVLVTLPIFWTLLLSAPGAPSTDRLVRRWCRILLGLAGCPVRTQGAEHLLGVTPAMLVANHTSYLDSLVLMIALPVEFRFVAKRELLSAPLIGTIIRKGGHLTVERFDLSRSVAGADRVVEALRRDTSLVVFPEGTFLSSPGRLLPFRLGAFKAAVEVQRPVVPVAIRGTSQVLPPDSWLPRPGTITVTVGRAIKPEEGEWREMVRLRDLVRGEITRAVGESGGGEVAARS
jgi:1-acyl-sn-glycerol-3-phosphate acyltransferase